jgi:hypothetical protein
VSIESELTKAASTAGPAQGNETAAMERALRVKELRAKDIALDAQRKELEACRQKLAVATESAESWRIRALRAERDVS